jgi:hypothetical protein
MCKSIQGFMGNVFCGSLPRSDLKLENELAFFGIGHGKGEWDGASASSIVKRALKEKQFHNLQRRLHDAFDVVQIFERRVIILNT